MSLLFPFFFFIPALFGQYAAVYMYTETEYHKRADL